METAVIYCRKSDVSALATDVSFDDQEDHCRQWAKQQGYSVYSKVYRESHSGADLDGRPQIWEAIDDVKQKRAQVLLVRNYDRLSRDATHSSVIEWMVEKAGGRIEAALEPVDPNDVNAVLMKDFKRIVAQAERLSVVARMRNGKRRRAERGELMAAGTPLYGYDWADDEIGKRTTYAEDPEAGPIVRRIFALVIAGWSLQRIAREFNQEGVLTPAQLHKKRGHGGRKGAGLYWSAQQVGVVVHERTYTGAGVAYRWQRAKTNKKTSPVARPADDPKRLKQTIPALIDQATFDAAQAMLATKSTTGRPPLDKEASWLRGHALCGCCGAKMRVRRMVDGRYTYTCPNARSKSAAPDACRGGEFSIVAHLLDEPIYVGLARLLTHIEPYREILITRRGRGRTQLLTAVAEGFEAKLAEKRTLFANARKLSIQTKDDDEEVSEMYAKDAIALNQEIHRLEKDYAEARDNLDAVNAENAELNAALERMRAGLPEGVEPTAETIKALRYDDRRLLLEVTGIVAVLFPTNWRADGRRVVVGMLPTWDEGTDDALVARLQEWLGPERLAMLRGLTDAAVQVYTKAGAEGVMEVTLHVAPEKMSRSIRGS